VYRVLFEIDEERNTVWILHIRRGARAPLRPEDLTKPGGRQEGTQPYKRRIPEEPGGNLRSGRLKAGHSDFNAAVAILCPQVPSTAWRVPGNP